MCAGVGVHSGSHVRVALTPAPIDTGIVFVRADVKDADNVIVAHSDNVSDTRNATTLRNRAGIELSTVEHFLSACAGLGIDNLIVEVDGPELPILDGSAAGFLQVLMNAGARAQQAPRRAIHIREPIEVRMGPKSAALLPPDDFEGLDLDITIRFADPAIGVQRRRLQLTPESFLAEVANARAFGFLADVEQLRAAKLGLGASLDNTVVVDAGRVINPEGLRFDDEFVRHKMLDALGDLALAGAPIIGRFVADQPGHALNSRLVRALLDTPEAWAWSVEEEFETVTQAGAELYTVDPSGAVRVGPTASYKATRRQSDVETLQRPSGRGGETRTGESRSGRSDRANQPRRPTAPSARQSAGEAAPLAQADATAFAPLQFERGAPSLVQIALHAPDDLSAALDLMRLASKGKMAAPSADLGKLAIGSSISVVLQAEGASVDAPLQSAQWQGRPNVFSFVVTPKAIAIWIAW